jgi:hypothetical protein
VKHLTLLKQIFLSGSFSATIVAPLPSEMAGEEIDRLVDPLAKNGKFANKGAGAISA